MLVLPVPASRATSLMVARRGAMECGLLKMRSLAQDVAIHDVARQRAVERGDEVLGGV